jgi:anthranilate synthase component 2
VKLLVLDNYDSFTYNLVHLIEKVSDIEFDVFRNDKISINSINSYDKILLSPGPGLPKDAGIMPELLQRYKSSKSILGICLGLQAIGETYGASLQNLETVVHGQATPISIISEDTLFHNCPNNFLVGRYHSWVINNQHLSNELEITAKDLDGNIMALKHKKDDVKGVQFHPESILSEYGETIINNWLKS